MAVQSKPARAPDPVRPRRSRPGVVRPRRTGLRSGADGRPPRVLAATSAPLHGARPSAKEGRPTRPDRGVGLLLVFVAAMLVMVVAVAIVAVADRWWVLMPVMLVDFAVTYAVIAMIARLLRDDGEPRP